MIEDTHTTAPAAVVFEKKWKYETIQVKYGVLNFQVIYNLLWFSSLANIFLSHFCFRLDFLTHFPLFLFLFHLLRHLQPLFILLSSLAYCQHFFDRLQVRSVVCLDHFIFEYILSKKESFACLRSMFVFMGTNSPAKKNK